MLDFAAARGFRSSGENPARWKGHLQNLLPARRKIAAVKHLAALPYSELPGFMRELRELPGSAARALEFGILCASRSGEVLRARWTEVDLSARMWLIPAARMKGGREHRVPLSDRALAILEGLPREGEFVFERHAGAPLSRDALQRVLKRMGRDNLPCMALDRASRILCRNKPHIRPKCGKWRWRIRSAAKVEQAYRRTDLFAKRVRLMQDWSSYCAAPLPRAGDNVQSLRAAQ